MPTATAFGGKRFFGATETPQVQCPKLSPTLGLCPYWPEEVGKSSYGTRYEEHIEIEILGFEGSKFSLPGSGSGIGQQQPLGWRWVWSCRRASGQKDALGCHLRLRACSSPSWQHSCRLGLVSVMDSGDGQQLCVANIVHGHPQLPPRERPRGSALPLLTHSPRARIALSTLLLCSGVQWLNCVMVLM